MIGQHLTLMAYQLVDSPLATTCEFWRRKYFDASDVEAADPRPFVDVLKERANAPA